MGEQLDDGFLTPAMERELLDSLTYSFSLRNETRASVLDGAWKSRWSIVKQAVVENDCCSENVLNEVRCLARMEAGKVSTFELLLLKSFAERRHLPSSDWVLISEFNSPEVQAAVLGNTNAPASAIESAFQHGNIEHAYSAIRNLNTPFPILKYAMDYCRKDEEGKSHEWNTVRAASRQLLRDDLTTLEREALFNDIFQAPLVEQRNLPGRRNPNKYQGPLEDLIKEEHIPYGTLILIWGALRITTLPTDGQSSYPLWSWSVTTAILQREDCPESILEDACLNADKNYASTAASHVNCPEHARIAAALRR